jgi:ketosteroid isomerase-like protein
MKKLLSISIFLCALVGSTLAQSGNRDADLHSIVEAERRFAAMSVEKGVRAAFIENLADDSVLFHPGPVNGKQWWSARPIRPGMLTWQPVFADVARSGEIGYTTGPWEFREKSLADKPVAFGQFVTVWKRQTDGSWKAAVDLGISNPPPVTSAPELKFPIDNQPDKKLKLKTNVEAGASALIKMESDFSKLVANKKTVDAFLSYFADDVRLFRMDAFPAVGREAARAMLAAKPGSIVWQPTKADVSRSGDLGYAYGTYEFKTLDGKGESGNYLRIWKRRVDGKWKVALDLLNPITPAPTN